MNEPIVDRTQIGSEQAPPLAELSFPAKLGWFVPSTRSRTVPNLLWFLVWIGVTAVGLWLTPSTHGHGTHQSLGLSPCPSALILGRPCPGCGLTTSWTHLLHGQIAESFRVHWLGPIGYLLFTVGAWIGGIGFLKGFRWNQDSVSLNRWIVVLVAIFFLYGGLRFALVTDYRTPKENGIRMLFGSR